MNHRDSLKMGGHDDLSVLTAGTLAGGETVAAPLIKGRVYRTLSFQKERKWTFTVMLSCRPISMA